MRSTLLTWQYDHLKSHETQMTKQVFFHENLFWRLFTHLKKFLISHRWSLIIFLVVSGVDFCNLTNDVLKLLEISYKWLRSVSFMKKKIIFDHSKQILKKFSKFHLSSVLVGSASVGTSSLFAYPLSYTCLTLIVVRSLCPCHLFSLFIL